MFTDFFIQRPVFSIALSALLSTVGLIAFHQLTIRQYPEMTANALSISTSYTGATAETVESFITTKIENAISGVDNIDYINSSSTPEKSQVVIHLALNADMNSALEDINSNLASVIKKLPEGVDNPVIKKIDPDATPAMIVTFSSTQRHAAAITDYLNRIIVPQLVTVSGIGSVDVLGNRTYAMRLWLNPLKMAALGVSASDIEDAFDDDNIQAQPGAIRRSEQVVAINAQTSLHTPDEFRQLVIKHQNNQLVRLSDIADIELGAESYTKSVRIDGQQAVGIGINIKSSANPLMVSMEAKRTLDTLRQQMPNDFQMIYARDNSTYIELSIHEVMRTMVEAAIFVFFVIFIFLGSLRAVLIPIVTIPLSLITTFAFMFAMHFSINMLTMLAFVFAIGMVVDDAIVVLENIHRHIETGLSPIKASLRGAREIVFVIVAMTFTLAAVYIPIGFTSGLTSILFKEFAFTLAAAVIISGFIALTLSPMMCSRLMKSRVNESMIEKKINHYLDKLTQTYEWMLTKILTDRLIIITSMCSIFFLGLVFFIPLYTTSTLSPDEDQGLLIGKATGPTGSNIDYTEQYTTPLETIQKSIPEINHVLISNGQGNENTAMMFFQLNDWSKRNKSVTTIQKELMSIARKIPGMKFAFFAPSSLPGSNRMYSTEFVVKSTGNYQELYDITQLLIHRLENEPSILTVDSDLKLDSPEVTIDIDRDKAAAFGMTMRDINTALNIALGQPSISSFVKDGQSYNIIPQLNELFRSNPNFLNQLYVKTETSSAIPLATIMTIKNTVAPNALNHFQQQRAATVSLILGSDYSQQKAIKLFESVFKKAQLPEYVTYDFASDTRQFIESGDAMLIIFIFSLIFIYLILCAQFESFIDPFIVMLTVPLGLVGALITLYSVGASLNIYTEIGLITLIGLISKHGILMVAFANRCRHEQKVCLDDAIKRAAMVRLRPILMTTAAVVLGAIPLILAEGAGSAARSQMGWTIIGGMLLGTLLTLFVIPTMYLIFKAPLTFRIAKKNVCD